MERAVFEGGRGGDVVNRAAESSRVAMERAVGEGG